MGLIRWLRDHLLPPVDDTDIDRATFRKREKAGEWERVFQSIATSERAIRGERRRNNIGRTPERRHG
jgi:hypothetical protein